MQSSRPPKWLKLVISFSYRQAALVSTSSRILQNVEKGLENGYKNFRKRSNVFCAFQRCEARCAQRRYSTRADRGCTRCIRPDHVVLGFLRFLFQRIWFFHLYVCASGEMAGAGNCSCLCPFAL